MEVGDYVRTKYGIAKYISDKVTKYAMYYVVDKDIMICNVEGWEDCVSGSNEIIKSSPNIMDLIEKGDYVNGFRVECDDLLGEYIVIFESEERKYKKLYLNKIYIKSIVTHEQFERMQYKVESEVN